MGSRLKSLLRLVSHTLINHTNSFDQGPGEELMYQEFSLPPTLSVPVRRRVVPESRIHERPIHLVKVIKARKKITVFHVCMTIGEQPSNRRVGGLYCFDG